MEVMNKHPKSEELPDEGTGDDGVVVDLEDPSIIFKGFEHLPILLEASKNSGAMSLGLRPRSHGEC